MEFHTHKLSTELICHCLLLAALLHLVCPGEKSLQVPAGTKAVLQCQTRGPDPVIWRKGDRWLFIQNQTVLPDTRISVDWLPQGGYNLVITDVSFNDSGVYTCRDVDGNTMEKINFTVIAPTTDRHRLTTSSLLQLSTAYLPLHSTGEPDTSRGRSDALAIVIPIVVVAVLIGILVVIFVVWQRRKKSKPDRANESMLPLNHSDDKMIVNNTGAICAGVGLPVLLPISACTVVIGLVCLVVCGHRVNSGVPSVINAGSWDRLKGLVRHHAAGLQHGWIDADRGHFMSPMPLMTAAGALDAFIICDFTETVSSELGVRWLTAIVPSAGFSPIITGCMLLCPLYSFLVAKKLQMPRLAVIIVVCWTGTLCLWAANWLLREDELMSLLPRVSILTCLLGTAHVSWSIIRQVLISRLSSSGQDQSIVTFACRVHYAFGFIVQSLTSPGLWLPLLVSVPTAIVLTVEALFGVIIQPATCLKLKTLLGAARQQFVLYRMLFTRWCRPPAEAAE